MQLQILKSEIFPKIDFYFQFFPISLNGHSGKSIWRKHHEPEATEILRHDFPFDFEDRSVSGTGKQL